MTEMVTTEKVDIKQWIYFGITVFLMFFFRFIPAPEPITPYGMAILGVFLGLVFSWSVSTLIWPSLLGLAAIGVSGYGSTATTFVSAFGNENWVLMFFGFIMFGAVIEAGITDWLAVKLVTVKWIKGRPWLLVSFIMFGVMFLSCVMNGMIILIFLFALFTDMFKKFGYPKGDRFVTMFFVGICLGGAMGTSIFPFKGWPLAPLGTIYKSSGLLIDNNKYMLLVISFLIVTMVMYIFLMKLLKCDVKRLVEVDFEQMEASIAGGLSARQKAVGIGIMISVLLSILVGVFGSKVPFLSQLGVYGVYAAFMAVMIMLKKEGRPLLDVPVAAKSVPWDMVFLYATAMIIATLLTSEGTGIAPFVMKLLMPIFVGVGEYMFLLILVATTLILTNIGNNLVVTFTMLSVVSMMLNQGVEFNAPVAVILITVCGLLGFVLPASSIYGAMIHSCELTTTKSSMLYGALALFLLIVASAIYFIPVGQLLF